MSQTVSAKAMCQYCDWSARHRGDNALEVATFLRRLCIEHTETMHHDEIVAHINAARDAAAREDA